jgi:hypothetical protein
MKKFLFIYITLIFIFLLGCSKKAAAPSESTTSASEDQINQKPSTNYFYVHNKFVDGSYRIIHTQGNWGRKCYVDFDDTVVANRDIKCVVETTELDARFLGLELNYNIPPFEKCSYLKVVSSYYFRDEAVDLETYADGSKHLHFITPTSIQYTKDAQGVIIGSTYKVTLSSSIYGSTPAAGTTSTYSSTSIPTADQIAPIYNNQATCRYNYGITGKGPNCCVGTYMVYSSSTSSTGTVTADAPVLSDWGGTLSACLDGPYKENDATNDKGWPIPILYRMTNQANNGTAPASILNMTSSKENSNYIKMSPQEIKKLSAKNEKFAAMLGLPTNPYIQQASNKISPLAEGDTVNYNTGSWKVASFLQKLFGVYYLANWLDGIQEPSPPRAFKDVEMLVGYETRSNSWTCYDDAYEMYARIKVYIRKWNTYPELIAATGDPADGAGNDDISGPETDFPEAPKQDSSDWEEIRDNGLQNGKQFPPSGYYRTDL